MPFTPLHWGPALLIGLVFPFFSIPILIIASVIPDIESAYVLFSNSSAPLHGISHTYLFGTLIGVFLSVMIFFIIKKSLSKILMTSLFGIYFHIFLDSFLYTDIKPFYPLDINPFYGMVSISLINSICLLSFIPVILIFIYKLYKSVKR